MTKIEQELPTYAAYLKGFVAFEDILDFVSKTRRPHPKNAERMVYTTETIDYLANAYLSAREKVYYEMVKAQANFISGSGDDRKSKKLLQRELSLLFGVPQPNISVFTRRVMSKLAFIAKIITNPITSVEFSKLKVRLDQVSPKLSAAASLTLAGYQVSKMLGKGIADMRTSMTSVAKIISDNAAEYPHLYSYVLDIRRDNNARSRNRQTSSR
jgi:hypothetical protein